MYWPLIYRAGHGLCVLLAMACWLLPAKPLRGQGLTTVNLELALLVDVSASVNAEEYRLQASGLAQAFRSPGVVDAISAMTRAGVAVCVIQWADSKHQQKTVDWTLLRSEADAFALAARIAAMQRQFSGGHTAVGTALLVGLRELENNRFDGLRKVIDLSGDGRKNDGAPLRTSRETVLARGVTINGLAIVNELPLLEKYFRRQLIGGEGAFVIAAQDYRDFARAIAEKLEREIRSAPITMRRPGAFRRFAQRRTRQPAKTVSQSVEVSQDKAAVRR